MIQFQYPEDREFFANLLTDGNIERLEKEFSDYFDFRHPAIKRWEFNKVKSKLLKELVLKYDGKCQLRIHPDCSKDGKFEPDHVIPLSTNELNKKLRHMARTSSEKVMAQSFGSNNLKNLTLACKRCNAFKKHRIILPNRLSNNLDFLLPYKVDDEIITVSSGDKIPIQKFFLKFNSWQGEPVNTYGGKAVIDFNGKPEYAETAVLKLFQQNGWDGVWVDKKIYRIGILGTDPVNLPEDRQKILDMIRTNLSGSGGCWDLFLWNEDRVLFVELKKSREDKIRDSQKIWLNTAVKLNLSPSNFLFLEWEVN